MENKQTVSTGLDIVEIEDFQRMIEIGGDVFLEKIFDSEEVSENERLESLAGMFALKEAVIKATGLKGGSWKKIKVSKDNNGKPIVSVDMEKVIGDGSISHTKKFAVAVFVVINA